MQKNAQIFFLILVLLLAGQGQIWASIHEASICDRAVRATPGAEQSADRERAIKSTVFAGLPSAAIPVSLEECGAVRGGDVNMFLNTARTVLTVKVIENDGEGRRGLIVPSEIYQIPVHNRVQVTILAPFMPNERSRLKLGSLEDLSTKPEPFPNGTWKITDIVERGDQYGPYMIRTNAIGTVEVFRTFKDSRAPLFMGEYEDIGYAIHANTIPFKWSQSNGCLVASQEDIVRLVNTINKDRAEDARSKQTINIRPCPY